MISLVVFNNYYNDGFRFSSESTELHGVVEVSFSSLKSVYSITDAYQFQLPGGHAECLCDCPGGTEHLRLYCRLGQS